MSKERRRLYEGMYIFSGTLSEDASKKATERITSSIEDKGGEVHKVFHQGRRKMAYEVNNMRQGYYVVMYFTVPTRVIADLRKEYAINEDLLRYLTLSVEKMEENVEIKAS